MGRRSRRKALRRKVEPKAQPASPAVVETPDDLEERRGLELRLIELLAERERQIREAGYRLFLAEGGDVIEQMLENGQLTMAAYHSQIRAEKEGGSGWGPTVTPYEDRMTRSLQMRLMRQKQEWIEDCRRRIQEDWDALGFTDDEEPAEEAGDDENTPQPKDTEFGNPGSEPAPETEASKEPVLSSTAGP
ncbi:MAG: hypothetical protein K8I27_06970 [Planctomycetes bacterium]|nr:hypothetical protein [Planctomycetota bacterium]